MSFNSSKNKYTVSLLWLTVLFLFIAPFLPPKESETQIELIIATIVLYSLNAFIIWILLDTKYTIRENQLYYASGIIRGKINIASIHKLEHVTTWHGTSLLKPALGTKGLTVHYNKFDDIYISPKEKEKFIAELLKINPEIDVV